MSILTMTVLPMSDSPNRKNWPICWIRFHILRLWFIHVCELSMELYGNSSIAIMFFLLLKITLKFSGLVDLRGSIHSLSVYIGTKRKAQKIFSLSWDLIVYLFSSKFICYLQHLIELALPPTFTCSGVGQMKDPLQLRIWYNTKWYFE